MVLESNTLDVLFVKDGQQGEDGKILYTWIKYAKDANGTGMTDDPNGAVYIGISYNNESSTESNDPTQYAWTKIQGADGKKGEDAYTIFLENENISFATDENRDPLSEQAYTSGITIMKGAKPVTDFIIGDIAKTQGIAVAKTDTAIAISVINGNPLPSDNGAIEIPITVGGTVFKKILSWTCSKKGDQGIQGPQGVQGEKGKDGTSVTITNKSITYQLSASGTVVPTGTWQTSPQTIPEGQYQWTKTSVTYSDGNKTESYSISYRGKNGSDGTSVKTTSTSVKYQVGDSGTTKPTGAWQNSVPTVAQGKYLWTQTIVNYSDGNSTESYSVSYKGIDGSNGSNGMNAATVYLYQRATSTPSKPSNALTYTFSTTKITGTLNNGWSTAIPTGTDAVYVTVASVSSKSDTTTIATSAWSAPVVLAQNGKSGSDGKAGLNVATIYLYQRATSKPSKPSASVTYTFNTGVASGLNNGWSQKIPDGTNPLYVTLATASSNTATDTVLSSEWSDVVVMAQNGEDGQDGTSITITSKSVTYQASSSGTTTPTGTWSTSVPTVNNGQYLWTKTTVQYSDDNKTEAYSVSYKGTNGTNGTSVTVSKTEVTYQVSTSGTTAPTGTWSTTMPTCDQGLYLWTKTYVKYSDGKDTTSYAVSYKGIDGEKFAFNMLRETNQGSKHWEQHSSGGKYFVEDFITEDNINAVKLICTEAISTSNWSYVSFKDIKMLKQLKPSTKYTLSYDIKANRSGTISHSICNGDASNFCTNTVVVNNIIGNETWQHISVVLTTNDLKTTPTNAILYLGRNALSKVGYSIIKNLKLTEGTVDTPWAPHPEDLEGRGVSQTVQYYLATSQASGVTSSTSGWSTDITTQKLTADKKYLWNCYQTKYSDGTSEPISTPKVIGVYGDKGQKGDNAKNLSITPSSQYFKSTDGGKTFAPNTITIKPTIQGEINFGKWQYSIDGGVSFADVVSGQKGLTVSNNVLAVSKDSSLYSDAVTMVTFRAVASDSSFYDTCSIAKIYDVSDIGDGRNLLLNTSSYRESNPLERTGSKTDDYSTYPKIITSIDLSANQKYTLQAKTDSNWATKHTIGGHTPSEKLVGLWLVSDDTNTFLDMSKGYAVFTAPKTTKYKLRVNQYSDGTNSYTIRLWDIKLEKGQSASGWSAAPEDFQTAILSTKSEISDVSLKVDKNKQAIEQRVEKTTYQQDLNLVKGDISKANEGLNKWRYEIYPKSLFASEYQGKSTMGVFAKNTNLTPSQSVLINDTDLSIAWNYAENYIGYALTFAKFSAAKSVAITFAHDDGAHIYLNGKLIGGSDAYSQTGESLTLDFVKGWNCIEVVVNEGASTEGFKLGTTLSALPECQLMNCYYGTPVARQSHITNQLVENTTNIDGISTKVSKVTSVIGEGGENFTSFKNEYSDFKQTMNGFKTTVGQTYVTKDDFNGLEIGGRNLLVQKNITEGYLSTDGKGSFVGSGGGDQTSDWIDVSGNKYITITLYEDFTNTNNSGRYCEYDADKNCISTIDYNPRQKSSVIIELKSNTKYIRVTAIECKTRRYKIEKGNKATDWTPAPEDVNGKIVNATSIAQQAADKFSWIVKSGTSSSNFEITDRLMNLVSANINLDGVVSFMNTAKGDGRKNLYNLDYSSFENVASQEDAICYAKDNGVTSVGIDSSVSYDGDKSLKISYTTANLNSSTTPLYLGSSANNYGCVKIQAGKQYILSCYVKSDSTTGLFMIDIQGHDTPDTKTDGLYLSNIDPRKLPGSSTGVNLSTDWQRAVCAIKVADNATGLYWSVVPLIWGKPSSSSAPKTFNIWVDCIMLEEVDSISNEPGTYILDKETIIDGGSIKTDTITGNQILAGSITADKIDVNSIFAQDITATGTITGANLIGATGTFSGQITATQGSIAGWTIIKDKMYTTGSGKYTGIGKYGSAYAFWAGATSNDNGNSAVFKVGHTGKLTATDADITGIITATSGKIGRYDITKTYLMTNSGSNASGIGGNQAFWAGAEDSNSAPFRVGYNGQLVASCATISGDITATTGKIGDLTLKDGILTGTGSYSEPYTEDDDGTVTSTITTNYITKLFGKGLNIDSTVKYSDEDDVYSYKVSVLPDEISFTDGEEIGMLGAGGLQILQVNDNSDSYSSEANEVSLSSGASNFYYTTPVNQTTDKYLHVCFSADGASFMASQGDKFNSFDIGYSSAKYSGNFAANKFVYTGNSLNYVECLEANDTTNIYFHSNGYYSFRVNNEGNWSNETQSVYITERGISVPGQIGLYSQEMSNYVARYYIAGSTKSTAIGNNSYQTRIYGSSVWANKAVSTSDVRLKQDFQSLDKFEDLYMQLQPVSFKYIDGYDKSEDRYFGLKAQPTEKLFEDMGENPDDYAMFNKFGIDHEDIKERIGYDVDFDEEHGLDYTNLITLNTHMVQKTRRELAELQKENAELKDMLKTIVKKINM